MNKLLASLGIAFGLILGLDAATALGQGYGTDNQNVLTPASGGMAGVSLALPQDVPSAIFGNPATLAQFQGTQFTMGALGPKAIRPSPTTAAVRWRVDHLPSPRGPKDWSPQQSA